MYFFSLSGYRCLGDGGTDRREILHDGRLHIGPGQDAPFLRAVPQEIPQLTCCLLSASPMLISISIHGPKVSAFFRFSRWWPQQRHFTTAFGLDEVDLFG